MHGVCDANCVNITTSINASAPITIRLHPEWAPIGAAHFAALVDEDAFYDENAMFRVVPPNAPKCVHTCGGLIQFGISGNASLNKKWSKPIADDPRVANVSNVRGTLAFATGGPNTRSTQLYVNLGDNSKLDPLNFPPFAEVVSGMEVLDRAFNPTPGNPYGVDQDAYLRKGNKWIRATYPGIDFVQRMYPVRPV